MFSNADLIHAQTRADALHDCVLIDVSAAARQAGIRYPVALTRAAWERCVAVPPGSCQDEAGRLWDVFWLRRCALRESGGAREVRFAVHVRHDNRERTPLLVRLKAVCGPGDQGELGVTMMLPEED
jgi:hypothetical protein